MTRQCEFYSNLFRNGIVRDVKKIEPLLISGEDVCAQKAIKLMLWREERLNKEILRSGLVSLRALKYIGVTVQTTSL